MERLQRGTVTPLEPLHRHFLEGPSHDFSPEGYGLFCEVRQKALNRTLGYIAILYNCIKKSTGM